MERFKKIFAAGVIFVTVLSMSVVTVPQAGAVASAGDLIKMDGLTTVYYLGTDGKRYVFPNEQTYFSWYSDFSSVVTIPQSELESYLMAANVTIRPGTKLVKITTNPTVYAVEPDGTLRSIVSEDNAKLLWGDDWAKRVVDVPDGFFTNYKTGSALTAGSYSTGSLVKFGDSADVYYINADGTVSKFASETVLTDNRFKLADVVTAPASVTQPTAGTEIAAMDSTLTDTSQGAGGIAGAGTGLTVALASDTPASATVITDTTATTGNGQANVKFVKVNFTAASDGDVKVTNLKFKRIGISADTDLDNLYLYDGATRLTDGSAISSNVATFNNASGLFTVAKGTTKSITLVGDMNYAATSGKTIGFSVVAASDVTTNGATVSGTFPMSGNLMSTANATDLGKLTTTSASVPSGTDTSITPATDQEVWRFTMQSTNQELKVEKLLMTAVGSIQLADLQNFKLIVSGAQVGSTVAAMTTGNLVTFDLSDAPLVITKGGSKTVSVRADIINGSTRTFYLSFQNQQDIIVKDGNYNVYIEPYAAGTFSVIRSGTANNWLIAQGSLAISRASTSPTADVAVDATNQTLAIFDFTASGEDIKVQNLNVRVDVTGGVNGGILNGKILVNDIQVGTTKNLTEATDNINFTFGSTFIVAAGTTAKVKIVGDIKTTTSTSFAGGETVLITLQDGSSNAQRQTSLGTFNAPSTDTVANTITVTSAALTATKFTGFGNRTVAAGTNDAQLGSFVIGAGAAEGVTVNSITVTLNAANSNSATISRMYLKDHVTGEVLGDVKSSISTSNIFTVNFNLAASNGKVVDLFGDIKSSANSGSWVANISTDGSGLSTSKSVAGGSITNAMQTITIGSGSLTATNGVKPTATILLGGATDQYMAQFSFSATNEGFTIDKLLLKVPNNFATSTSGITIKYKDKLGAVQQQTQVLSDAGTTFASATATFTGLTMYVSPTNPAKLDVYVDLTTVGAGAGASGASGAITFDWDNGFNATGDSGGTPVTTVGTADLTNNTFYVRKFKPTFATIPLTGTPASSNPILKFTVIADTAGTDGNIEIKQLGFNIATTTVRVTNVKLYDENGVEITTTGGTSVDSSGNFKLLVSGVDDTVLSIGKTAITYMLKGTVAGWTTGASLTTSFVQDTTAVANNTANGLTAGQNLVWSDMSATAHTTATTDWTNGFLVRSMTTAQAY